MQLFNIDLEKFARYKFGQNARVAAEGSHLYDWRVLLDGRYYDLDIDGAAKYQFGQSFQAVATGCHTYDWKALDFRSVNKEFIPVLLVSNNKFREISQVIKATENLKSVLKFAQNWYLEKVGKTFQITTPLVLPSLASSDHWIKLSNYAKNYAVGTPERDMYFKQAWNDITRCFPMLSAIKYACAVYVGETQQYTDGMQNGGSLSVFSPDICQIQFNPDNLSTADRIAISAVLHEIGHNLGLDHRLEFDALMRAAHIPGAKLYPDEISLLNQSPFLRSL